MTGFEQWLINNIQNYLFLIPIIPFIAFIINGLFGKYFTRGFIHFVGVFSIFISFLISLLVAYTFIFVGLPEGQDKFIFITTFDWIKSSTFTVAWGFVVDQLTIIMILVVTGVGFIIHFYSIGYMKDDPHISRFYAYMNLFVSSMLILVMSDNLILLFLGWEGVGVCSYLLISFWYKNDEFAEAGKKAFIFNRIGDAGFILGIALIFMYFGTINIGEMNFLLDQHATIENDITTSIIDGKTGGLSICVIITILLFIGATGKSAQIPLYSWLPDAMAGPTPVSALIHAATMVTAGVYMIARLNFIYNFELAAPTMIIILVIAVITSIAAGIIGLSQNDIKKVLAYSTVSQIGFMFMALSAGAYSVGIFHLMTHAFFKALLFLSAGSVIIACGHIQDIRKMGGLAKKIPITFFCFLIGAFSLSGILPYISGFLSKDQILEVVELRYGYLWWGLVIVSVGLTAAYTWRLMSLTFWGKCKIKEDIKYPISDRYFTIRFSIIILAILSLFGGLIGIPEFLGGNGIFNSFFTFLTPVLGSSIPADLQTTDSHVLPFVLMAISLIIAIVISYIIWYIYKNKENIIDNFVKKGIGEKLNTASSKLLYVDIIYEKIIAKPFRLISTKLWKLIDEIIIDRIIVEGFGKIFIYIASLLRRYQTGNLNFYALIILVGVIVIFIYISYLFYKGFTNF